MIKEDLIKVTKTTNSKLSEVDFDNIPFGRQFSDHMFVMDYHEGKWQTPEIIPFQNLSMSPAMSAIHYGQSIFEGLKAFKNKEGRFGLFRPEMNIKRMNLSAERMCMPQIPEDLFMEALVELVRLDRDWIPDGEGSALYIRPFMFATDEYIGVKPSNNYRFMIFTCPVGAYYPKPVKVKIERHFSRSVQGGTGYAKAAGNYAGSMYPAKLGQDEGFDQLVWTDAKEHKYIEESGTMNIMFRIGDKLITPAISETILSGITRDSVITLAKEWGYDVEHDSRVEVQEVLNAARNGELSEAFGLGTAATVAHIAEIADGEDRYELPPIENREFSKHIADALLDIRKFRADDKHGWMVEL